MDLASVAASRATVAVVVVLRYTQLSSSSPSVELSRFEGGKNKVVGGASGSERVARRPCIASASEPVAADKTSPADTTRRS